MDHNTSTELNVTGTGNSLAVADQKAWLEWRAGLSPTAQRLNERLGQVASRSKDASGKTVTAPKRDRMWLLRGALSPDTFTTSMAWLMNERIPSENTVRNYADDIRHVAAALASAGLPALDIATATTDHVTVALDAMKAAGHSARTINRRMTALQSLYAFHCFRSGQQVGQLVSKYSRPKMDESALHANATQALTKKELTRIYDECRTPAELLAVFLTLAVAGRAEELVSADLSAVRATGDEVTITLSRKGGKVRTFPLSGEALDLIDLVHGERRSGPVLLRANGEAMTKAALDALLERLGRRAAVWTCKRAYTRRPDTSGDVHSFETCRQCKDVTPHVLRATKLIALHEDGWPLQDIQAFADHNDPKTTSGYLQRWRDKQLRADGVKASSKGVAKYIDRFRRD